MIYLEEKIKILVKSLSCQLIDKIEWLIDLLGINK